MYICTKRIDQQSPAKKNNRERVVAFFFCHDEYQSYVAEETKTPQRKSKTSDPKEQRNQSED